MAGRGFQNDAGRFDYRDVSAFMLLNRLLKGEDITPRLRYWRDARGTMLRVLTMIGHPTFWVPKGWYMTPSTPGLFDGAKELARLAGEHGLYLRYTLFADAQYCAPTGRHAYVEGMGDALRDVPNKIVELANEPSLNGFKEGDPSELQSLARRYKSVDPYTALAHGAEHGERGHLRTYVVPPADYVTFHAERVTWEDGWAWVRRLGEYGPVDQDEMPAVSGEPINAGDEGAPGDHQADPAIWFGYGAVSRIKRFSPCFHFHAGLWADLPNAATERCLEAWHAGLDAVPFDFGGAWCNGQHECSPWRGFSQTDPPSNERPSRIYGRVSGAQYVGVSLREPAGWQWPDLRFPVERIAGIRGERFDASVWS